MNGVLLIDKPSGKTSYDIVEVVKRATGIQKIGHTGTLDPLATGVLPVCLNEATKLVQFLILEQKAYRATMLLGVATDTYDISGTITDQQEPHVTEEAIRAAFGHFLGRLEQKPPRFSAIKHKGKPMYKWARQGVVLDPPPRIVEIEKIDIVAIHLPYVTFDVTCSKGTYIRSLCYDIGKWLGYPACLTDLRRTRSGHFLDSQAISIDRLHVEERYHIIEQSLISMSDALMDLPSIVLTDDQLARVRNGRAPMLNEVRERFTNQGALEPGTTMKLMDANNKLHAVAQLRNLTEGGGAEEIGQAIKILRVFNN